MAVTESRGQQSRGTLLKRATAFSRWVTQPAKNAEPRQHSRIRLLSAFFILMVFNTLTAALLIRKTGGNLWIILVATSAMFLAGYVINRSQFYRLAILLAVLIPAVPPIVIAIYQPPQINLTAEFMWLALPLLAAGLMLKLRQSYLVAFSYILLFTILAFSGRLDFSSLVSIIVFTLIITFFVIAAVTLQQDGIAVIKKQMVDHDIIMKKLQESEEKFSKAFMASPDAISISAINSGAFIDVNDSYTRTTGYTREELINNNAEKFNMWVDPRDREKMIQMATAHKKMRNEEMKFRYKSGEIGTSLVSTEFLQVSGQECLMVVSADITDYKHTRKTLNQFEEKFSKVFKAIPEAVAITTLKDGVFLEVNDSFLTLNGYTEEEVIGHTGRELNIWSDSKDRDRMKELMEKDGHFKDEEFTLRKKSGELCTILFSVDTITFNGEPSMLTIGTNITERKNIEKALRDSEEKFSKAFKVIPEAISISRIKDGVFVDVNAGFCRMVKKTYDEVIGHTAKELDLSGNTPEWREQVIKKIKEHGPILNDDQIFMPGTKNKGYNLFSADIIDIGGEPCMISIVNDVTELKKMEIALRTSEETLSKAFKSIPEAITISRVKDGVFLEVNQNFCRLNGHTREEIIGHTGDEIGIPLRSGQRDQIIRTIQEHGAIINRENMYNPKTDKMQARLYSADIVEIGGESCLISVSLDITERKRMEETLEKEAVRRRVLIEQSKDGIAITDQSGKVYEANIRFAEMLGYTPEEILKLHVWDWDHTVPQEQMAENVKLMGGKRDHFETQYYRKDGSILYVELSTNSVQFSGQMFIFSVSRDISERKRMEKALRESEEKFSKAFQAIPESIAISTIKDGVFLEVNDTLAKSIGRTREEMIGHTGGELGIFGPPGYFFELVKRVKEHGKISNEELVLNQENGNKTVVLFSADITEINGELCLITINTDITERKRLQESLANEAVRRSILMEQSSDGIVILDHNGAVYETNRRFAEMLGYSQEETLKLHLWDWAYMTTREETLEMLRTADPAGGHFETKHYRKDGSLFDVEISTNSAEFSGQKLIFCVCRDITKRKLAEKELTQAMTELQLSSAQLKATNKELESFSYSVSHDLRSPLRSIDGFSQAILEDYAPKLDETGRDYLNRMRGASQKMGELIDGLLKLSRLTRGELHYETIDLSALAQEISRRLQETNPERKAEFIIGPGLKATGDPQMLRVLMENLLGNAWKFTKKVPQAAIEFNSTTINGKPTFFVKDNGAGFDMAYADKLFGAFVRLHTVEEFPGTGIGLATVQRIINRHGGSIRAEGAVDQGATFYFNL